eukprot:139502-Pelagomonas_calceolata.AAC.4
MELNLFPILRNWDRVASMVGWKHCHSMQLWFSASVHNTKCHRASPEVNARLQNEHALHHARSLRRKDMLYS